MKTKSGSINVRLIVVTLLLIVSLTTCYHAKQRQVYKSIKIKMVDSAIVEYGSGNYDLNKLIDSVEGEIVSVKKDLNTKKVGTQEVVIEVQKDDVIKTVPIKVEVKDTIAPTIKLKNESISLTEGDEFDVLSNLESVYDQVSGDIKYKQLEEANLESDKDFYTIETTLDKNTAGVYPVTIKAVDPYGNKSEVTYEVVVDKKEEIIEEPIVSTPQQFIDNSYVGTGDKGSLVEIAYSLVGSPYVAGGNSPSGFDCSGFVQYVYSQVGLSVSRSSSAQMHDGVGVSYENAMPGDILSWGYVDGVPTHSAIYVGNGMMIHATNPRQGVLLSNVSAWTRGSGSHVIAVRRI